MQKVMRKILLLFIISASIIITSCLTIATDLLSGAILGYSPSQIDEAMRTLDPNASYSKRAGIFMKLMGDEENMKRLESQLGGVVESALSNKRDGIEEITIPTPEHNMTAYLVYPEHRDAYKRYPVIIFSHGGGFELWSFKEYEGLCTELADRTDSCVLFYEYRKSPQFKFPCGVNDTFETYKWLMDDNNALVHNLDNTRFVFAGDSSGGNFMAGLMLRVAEEHLVFPKGVLLLYPSTDVTNNFNYSRLVFSGLEDPSKYYVTSFEYLVDVQNKYLEKPEDAYKPYASPLIMLEGLVKAKGYDNTLEHFSARLEPPLDYFPPHLICVPEIDTLRDEGKMYYALLRIFHAPARMIEYPGMFHGFAMTQIALHMAEKCVNDSIDFLNEVFKSK